MRRLSELSCAVLCTVIVDSDVHTHMISSCRWIIVTCWFCFVLGFFICILCPTWRCYCGCSIVFSSCFTFTLKFALASPVWKQARSTRNFNVVCRVVTIHHRLLFSSNPTRDLKNYSLSIFHPNTCLCEKTTCLAANAVTAWPSAGLCCTQWQPGCVSPMQTEFLLIRSSRI